MKPEPETDEQEIWHGQSVMTTFAIDNFQATKVATENRKRLETQVTGAVEIGLLGQKRAVARPRKAAACVTAADRRRTQIRLAQRAFRDRKESTITRLGERVKELEKTNADIRRHFYTFYQLVLSQGLFDTTAADNAQFMAITDNLLRLCGKNGEETGYNQTVESRTTAADSIQSQIAAGSSTSAGRCSVGNAILDGSAADVERNNSPVAVMTTYQVVTQATSNNASFPIHPTMQRAPTPASFVSIDSHYTTVPLASSIANQQLSFSQRLRRRMIEHGVLLASMPNLPPKIFDTFFGFSQLLDSRGNISQHISRQLTDNITPFEDQANTENGLQDENMEQHIGMVFKGETEILDANEIEVYLRRCGIVIPHLVEYVDANVDVSNFSDTPTLLNGTAAISTYSTRNSQQNHLTQISIDRTSDPNISVMQGDQILTPGSIAPDGPLPYMGSAEIGNIRDSTWTTPKLTVNAGLLVEELALHSVRTGKQPGIHIKDINRAVKVAAGLI